MSIINMNVQVLPAVMPGSYAELEDWVRVLDGVAPWVQIDVMDGVFVPAISWPYSSVTSTQSIVDSTKLPSTKELSYEVHLMVQEPEAIGRAFVRAGAKRIVVHVESFADTERARTCLNTVQSNGAEVGIALLLETPLEVVHPFVTEGLVSVVQVMSITPIGVQGAPFDERIYERVRTLRARYPLLDISVDGGIKKENAKHVIVAGATQLVVGSAIVKSPDPAAAYEEICATL